MAVESDAELSELLAEIEQAAHSYDDRRIEAAAAQLVNAVRANSAACPDAYFRQLQQALEAWDRPRVEVLCTQLIEHARGRPDPYPLQASATVLKGLQRKRYFSLMISVGEVLLQTGQDAPVVRRRYAQALLDTGQLAAALDVLCRLEADCLEHGDPVELAEARGLKGRAYKQMYMDAAGPGRPGRCLQRKLESSVAAYTAVYEERSDCLWHGINAVAVLERARRDGVELDGNWPDASALAERILAQVAADSHADIWQCAIAAEACLALGDYQQALAWLVQYTRPDSQADAFEYASTLRQLEQVWGLDSGDATQAGLLHPVRSALLRQEGGQLELPHPAKDLSTLAEMGTDEAFEQVLGADRYKTFQWYRTGLERATGVAKICDSSGNGHGTGFLLRGVDVHPDFAGENILVTNAHVISNDDTERGLQPPALHPDEARVCFEARSDGEQQIAVKQLLFSSPRHELDCTIVSLAAPVDLAHPFPIAKRLPLLNKNQRVYVIGHPRGSGLSYSINDNALLDHDDCRIHYRAPTEGGSSGSPVFNQNWDLLALHHAGGMAMKRLKGQAGNYPANEGLCFQSIRQAVAARLG